MGFFDKILAVFSKPKAKDLPATAIHRKSAQSPKRVAQKAPAAAPTQKAEPVKVAVPVERRSNARSTTHKGLHVLLVDDSATIVAALRKMLRSAGCITREAMDAEKALELVRLEQPDLVFLDIVLPGMNGFAALRLMRRDAATQHIPVIMISGNEQATEEFYAKRIGADDFMKKPFSRSEVFGRIDKLIENNKLCNRSAGVDERSPKIAVQGAAAAKAVAAPTPLPAATSREVTPAPLSAPQARPNTTREEPAAANPPTLSALEARTQLTAMGLQYFSQEQFAAAVERGDQLALQLFIAGGGISISKQFAENPL